MFALCICSCVNTHEIPDRLEYDSMKSLDECWWLLAERLPTRRLTRAQLSCVHAWSARLPANITDYGCLENTLVCFPYFSSVCLSLQFVVFFKPRPFLIASSYFSYRNKLPNLPRHRPSLLLSVRGVTRPFTLSLTVSCSLCSRVDFPSPSWPLNGPGCLIIDVGRTQEVTSRDVLRNSGTWSDKKQNNCGRQ